MRIDEANNSARKEGAHDAGGHGENVLAVPSTSTHAVRYIAILGLANGHSLEVIRKKNTVSLGFC
jgi:hypothetical protein